MTTLKLNTGDFQDGASRNPPHIVRPAAALDYKTLFSPLYWSNVARQLAVDDLILVRPAGNAYFAVLLVVEVGPTLDKPGAPFARVIEVQKKIISAAAKEAVLEPISSFKVKDLAGKGWAVVRKTGGEIVKEGCTTEAEAAQWLTAHSTAGAAEPADTKTPKTAKAA